MYLQDAPIKIFGGVGWVELCKGEVFSKNDLKLIKEGWSLIRVVSYLGFYRLRHLA